MYPTTGLTRSHFTTTSGSPSLGLSSSVHSCCMLSLGKKSTSDNLLEQVFSGKALLQLRKGHQSSLGLNVQCSFAAFFGKEAGVILRGATSQESPLERKKKLVKKKQNAQNSDRFLLFGTVVYFHWEAMLISYLANRVTPLPFKSLSGKRLKLAHNSETIFFRPHSRFRIQNCHQPR